MKKNSLIVLLKKRSDYVVLAAITKRALIPFPSQELDEILMNVPTNLS